jgi:hypothetical protein
MASPAPNEPTKPSEPSFVGFVGCSQAENRIIQYRFPEQVTPRVCTTATAAFAIPPGVRLIEWNLKDPVPIETCAIVAVPALFAESTLAQLAIALAQPKRWVGWSVPQLIDRLSQVGVQIEIDSMTKLAGHKS